MRSPILRRAVAAVVGAFAVACGGDRASTAPRAPSEPTYAGYPGFDIAVYPGDATLSAWRFPASPYHWVGYYLAAPCHRDPSWMGHYGQVTSLGWGTAVLYVGQQDWSAIPDIIAISRRGSASPVFDRSVEPSLTTAVACSASLLSAAQGTAEAADAAAKAAGEGVPPGSAIFLDVEYVTTVSSALVDYMSAWIAGLLADGRFRPAIYCAKSNAAAVYTAAIAAYAAAGRHDAPPFWIASSTGFAITSAPTDVGLTYATVWQGLFDVSQSWGGIGATIDVSVANAPSPSVP
jgi:hypothetical protein